MTYSTLNQRYRPKDVAERYRFALASVYRWIKKGEIESVRIGGTIIIPAAEIARLDRLMNHIEAA